MCFTLLLFAVGGGCCRTTKGNDMQGGLKSPDANERSRAVIALGSSVDRAGAVRTLASILRNDADRGVRIDATVSLGTLGGPEATALLVEKAKSEDESIVRVAALKAIEKSKDPEAIPGLLEVFRLSRGHDDVVAQIGAEQALLKIGAPGIPQLLPALADPSPKVREAVVEVLGKIGDPSVADRIGALQNDPDLSVRRAAERAQAALQAKKH